MNTVCVHNLSTIYSIVMKIFFEKTTLRNIGGYILLNYRQTMPKTVGSANVSLYE